MKNVVLLIAALVLGTASTMAATAENKVALRNAYNYNNSFIFVENGITFSVYPDGEFDFYVDNYISGRRNGVTFNSGFDYSPYAQYDDYGAVIQVENVPIYYDYYGRVNQIGSVDINYRNGRVRRVGGLHVYYNNRGLYDYHTGYINVYNRYYVYRPYHRFFVRPAFGFSLVFGRPYRQYYAPIRYTYYRPYRNNYRRAYASIGEHYRYNRGHKRHQVYRNDKRVAVRENRSRRTDGLRNNQRVASNNKIRARSNGSVNQKGDAGRNNRSVTRNNVRKSSGTSSRNVKRNVSDNNSRIARSTTVRRGNDRGIRSNSGKTVSKRTVTTSPRSKTVTRSTTSYKQPQSRNTGSRTVAKRTTQRSSQARPASKSNRSSNATAGKSASRRTVSKAPARSSRSNNIGTRSKSSRTRAQ